MKQIKRFLLPVLIAVIAIVLLKPVIEKYQLKRQYNFELFSQDGPVNLESFKDKVLVIYFGYMYCPDVCPTSLGMLSQAFHELNKEELTQVKGLFISVDPQRDNLKDLKEYSEYFHPNFMGATGAKAQIDEIVKNYGAFYKKVYLPDSKMDYSVSHTSYLYVINKEGIFHKALKHYSTPQDIVKAIRELL